SPPAKSRWADSASARPSPDPRLVQLLRGSRKRGAPSNQYPPRAADNRWRTKSRSREDRGRTSAPCTPDPPSAWRAAPTRQEFRAREDRVVRCNPTRARCAAAMLKDTRATPRRDNRDRSEPCRGTFHRAVDTPADPPAFLSDPTAPLRF